MSYPRTEFSTAVTDLRDARAFREMGVPLNTPVIERQFSPEQEKQINKAYRAFATFRKRIDATFCADSKNKNRNGFEAARRAHDKLAYLIRQSEKETADPDQMAASLLIGKLTVCTDGWQELFDAADDAANAGEGFTISPTMLAALWPFNGKRIIDAIGA